MVRFEWYNDSNGCLTCSLADRFLALLDGDRTGSSSVNSVSKLLTSNLLDCRHMRNKIACISYSITQHIRTYSAHVNKMVTYRHTCGMLATNTVTYHSWNKWRFNISLVQSFPVDELDHKKCTDRLKLHSKHIMCTYKGTRQQDVRHTMCTWYLTYNKEGQVLIHLNITVYHLYVWYMHIQYSSAYIRIAILGVGSMHIMPTYVCTYLEEWLLLHILGISFICT